MYEQYIKKLGEAELKIMWGRRFLEKLYSNSIQNAIATLYSDKAIKASDVEELREFLD